MEKRFFSCREIAEYLGICEKSVRRLIDKGLIPFARIGRSVRVDKKRLDNSLNQNDFYSQVTPADKKIQ